MSRALIWTAATAASLAITACASPDPGSETAGASNRRQCFMANNVRNFRVVDSRTVNVRAGRETYRLDMFGNCPDLRWTEGMGLATTGSPTVCVGSGLGTTVVTRGPSGPQRCSVQAVTRLTPEEIEALPARHRP